MKKIVINLGQGMDQLKTDFPEADVVLVRDRAELMRELPEAEVLVSWGVDDEMLDRGTKLDYVASLYAGVDKLPLNRLQAKEILLTTGRGIHVIHMAEYALMMMILHARSLDKLLDQQRRAIWAGAETHPQDEIYGKKLGIIGLGAIGQEIAKKASFMGMEVVGVRRTPKETDYVTRVYDLAEGIETIFKSCDYIINLLPHTPATNRLIDHRYFDLIQPHACLINMGRGDTVNEDDLYEAIKSGQIKRYITDVFDQEPLEPNSRFWQLDNIVITPHISGPNLSYMAKAYPIVKTNLTAYLAGSTDEMVNVYSHERGY